MSGLATDNGEVVSLNGANLYIAHSGNAKGSPLLFLHGGMGNSEDFRSLTAQLSEFRIIAMDARAQGRSTRGNASLTYRQLTQDVLAVQDHLGCPRVTVVGFSDGGIVGYRLAIDHENRVDKLVAIGAPNTLTPDTAALLEKVTPESWDANVREGMNLFVAISNLVISISGKATL